MTEIFIANLTAAALIVALLGAVCRTGFLAASGRFDSAHEAKHPSVSFEPERRAASQGRPA